MHRVEVQLPVVHKPAGGGVRVLCEIETDDGLTGFGMTPDVPIAGRLQPGGITYANLENLELQLADGSDDITVQNTHFGTTTIQAEGGADSGGDRVGKAGDEVVEPGLHQRERLVVAGDALVIGLGHLQRRRRHLGCLLEAGFELDRLRPMSINVLPYNHPIRIAEMMATLRTPAFVARATVHNPLVSVHAKEMLRRAFRYQADGRCFSLVEILSTCPTNWGIPPAESTKWLEKHMLPYYPLGIFKTPESGSREPLPLEG